MATFTRGPASAIQNSSRGFGAVRAVSRPYGEHDDLQRADAEAVPHQRVSLTVQHDRAAKSGDIDGVRERRLASPIPATTRKTNSRAKVKCSRMVTPDRRMWRWNRG